MAGVVNFTFEHDPSALTDNVETQLNGVLDLDTPVAGQLTKHARAVRPGIPGVAHVEYRFILLLLGSVARVDGSPVTGALEVFRGVWQSAWISAALTKLAELGLFSQTYASFEAMLLSAARLAARQAVYPAEFIFGAADWSVVLGWLPGHFGAAANQPWHVSLTFDRLSTDSETSLLPLFGLCFECAPYFVRAQVLAANGSFCEVGTIHLEQMEKYACKAAGSFTALLAHRYYSLLPGVGAATA